MGEILNRREQIIANKLPPEIPNPDTLVTKTDYATASKAGVVKIGSNINVSSGKISVPAASDETAGVVKIGSGLTMTDGVLSASGITSVMDLLYSQPADPAEPEAASTEITLAHSVSDYKFLLIVIKGNASADPAFVETMILSTEAAPYNTISLNSGSNGAQVHKFAVNGDKIKDNQSGNVYAVWYRVYGIK